MENQMLSRRRFLGSSGLGMLSIPAGCCLPAFQQLVRGEDVAGDMLDQLAGRRRFKDRMLGYPVNMNEPSAEFFAWREKLHDAGIDRFSFNNVGDPYKKSPFPFNTHDFERELIRQFGSTLKFPENDVWGFLSHSGTDSNMHGMYLGRTILQGRTGQRPKAYYTKEAHYSVQILADLLGMESEIVSTREDGSMDSQHLAQLIRENNDFPALVVATVGTTFKGSIDDVDGIRKSLASHPSYLHLDAALFGGYLPFTDGAQKVVHQNSPGAAGRYDSIAISCHKFFGFASPAGLFITTRNLFAEFKRFFSTVHDPEYIHHVPGTITCSRDAVKPAEFYFYATPVARSMLARDAELMLKNTGNLLHQLQTRFPDLSPVRANRFSNTVYFRYPGDEVAGKYALATMHLEDNGQSQRYAHAVVMPHVDSEIINNFLTDLEEQRSRGLNRSKRSGAGRIQRRNSRARADYR